MSFTKRKRSKSAELKPRCYRCARARAVKHVPPYGYLCAVCRKLVNDMRQMIFVSLERVR